MAIDTTLRRSRRALLGAGLGAVAASVASAALRPLPMAAAGDDSAIIHVGDTITDAQTQTTLANKANNNTVLYVASNADLGHGAGTAVSGYSASGNGVYGASPSGHGVTGVSGSGYAVYGLSTSGYAVYGLSTSGYAVYGLSFSGIGVSGSSDSGYGVRGVSGSGYGVYGASGSGYGVYGDSTASDKPAILGTSSGGNTGVQGFSGAYGSQPTPPAKTGVYGYAAQDANANGVKGQTTLGRGVLGLATTGLAIYGSATSGNGVRGYAATGAAGWFSTSGPKIGTALRAIGKVKLDNCAGVATIASGHNSVVVTPGTDLVATSAVVATLMGNPGGATTVQRVAVNATADTFTIYLTANATAAVTVAWHVFG
jgi:hypothetical protein